MNKKLLLLPLMVFFLLVLSSFVSADNSLFLLECESDLADTGDTITQKSNLEINDGQAIIYNTTEAFMGTASCQFNGANSIWNNTFNPTATVLTNTTEFWFYPFVIPTWDHFWSITDGCAAGVNRYVMYSNWEEYNNGAAVFNNAANNTAIPTMNWSQIIITHNGSGWFSYLNGNPVWSVADTSPLKINMDCLMIAEHYEDSELNFFEGMIDNLRLTNESYSDYSQILASYNGGAGVNYGAAPPPPPDTINMSDSFPNDGEIYAQTSMDFNATINSTYTFNATLWLGYNGTAPTVNTTLYDYTAGSDILVNFTLDLVNGNYTYYINVSSADQSEQSTSKNFWIDTIDPIITWITPTDYDVIVGSFTTNIFIADNNLYAYYLNLTSGGALIYNTSNSSLTGLTTKTIDDLFPISNLSGEVIATLKVCDGHTAQVIDMDARMYFDKSELTFDEVKIYQENKLLTKDIDYTYKGDRYSFNFETTLSISTSAFIVSSPSFIDILHDKSTYAGHLITGDKWIDFETDDLQDIKIDRINSKSVRITITKKKPTSDWNFNSIGELNCVVESKNFLSVNATYNTPTSVLAGSANTFLLNVTYNSTYYSPIPTATLYYNGTGYNPSGVLDGVVYSFSQVITSPAVASETILPFNWSYAVNGTTYYTGNNSLNISPAYIDNCSTYNLPFVNYSLKDEVSGIPLTGSIEYIFEIQNGAYSFNYNDSQPGGNHSFCLNPAWANFTTDITLQYAATGYGDRDYVADNFWVDNNTELITLYLLSAGNATEITIHVVDENDYDLPNVFIEAYRYNIDSDQNLLVETEYTDSEGNSIFDLQTGSVYYSFKFYQAGDLKLSTTRFKLFATTYDYVLREDLSSRLGDWLQLKDEITRSLTYNNNTQVVNFTWSTESSLASFFCLNISFGNGTAAYGGCSSSLIDSLAYTITTRNVTYSAYGTVTTTTGYSYVLETLSIDTREGWRTFGRELGLVLSLLIFMVCGLIGLFNKNAAIIMACVAMITIYLFGLLPMGSGALMGILVIGVIALVVLNRRQSP